MADTNMCLRCKAHNSFVTDFKNGEIVCENCGNVLEERIIDDTYEKRNFGSENGGNRGESRVGGPLKATDGNNLGTNIVLNDKNGNMRKMRGVNNTYNQSPLERGFDEINKFLDNKNISKAIVEDTKDIFDQVPKLKNMKGRNLKSMILAMYYCASKNSGVALSFKEIAYRFNYEEKKIKKAFNYIKSAIGYHLSPEKLNQSVNCLIDNFIPSTKEVYEFKELAQEIASKINESCLLEGRNPNTIAALSLIIAAKLYKDKDMSKEVNRSTLKETFCSENTLDNAFEKVRDSLDKIIPQKYYTENMTLSIK